MAELETTSDQGLIKALAHPLRVRILEALTDGAASPVELAEVLDAPLANVSYHVRTLAKLGVLRLVKTTPRRGAVEHHYELAVRPVIPQAVWGRLPEPMRDAVAQATLKDIARDVEAAARSGTVEQQGLRLAPLVLDQRGWNELSGAVDQLLERAMAIEAASVARSRDNDGANAHGGRLVMMLFETPRRGRRGARRP